MTMPRNAPMIHPTVIPGECSVFVQACDSTRGPIEVEYPYTGANVARISPQVYDNVPMSVMWRGKSNRRLLDQASSVTIRCTSTVGLKIIIIEQDDVCLAVKGYDRNVALSSVKISM